jgi:hypothetical protein
MLVLNVEASTPAPLAVISMMRSSKLTHEAGLLLVTPLKEDAVLLLEQCRRCDAVKRRIGCSLCCELSNIHPVGHAEPASVVAVQHLTNSTESRKLTCSVHNRGPHALRQRALQRW